MHALEDALGSAAPGREPAWRADVLAALAVLDDATNDEYINAKNPDSLMSDIKRTQPRLRTRGGDWPFAFLASRNYRQVWDGMQGSIESLEGEDRRALLGDTARRVYGLSHSG